MSDDDENQKQEPEAAIKTCEHDPVEPHTCLYADELYGDETPCRCCPECERECARDI